MYMHKVCMDVCVCGWEGLPYECMGGLGGANIWVCRWLGKATMDVC